MKGLGFPKDLGFETQKLGGISFFLGFLLSHPFPEAVTTEQPNVSNQKESQGKR